MPALAPSPIDVARVLDGLADAVGVIDLDTFRIVDANRAEEELTGLPRARLVGTDAREFWPEEAELRARVAAHVEEARRHGAARAFGLPLRTAAGKVLPLDVTTRTVAHDDRLYAIRAARDATPRLALELMQQEAAQLRAVRAVANTAAHEINNPLSVILGSLELLRGRVTGAAEARWLDRALAATHRLAEIADRLDGIRTLERLRREQGLGPALDLRRSSPLA